MSEDRMSQEIAEARAEAERAEELEMSMLGQTARLLPEPEYEYALRGKKWHWPSDARFDTLEEVHEWMPRYLQKPQDWVIVRRRRAGNWEDVQ